MTGMEHAIEQAAKVIEDTYLSGGDMWGDDLARALAEAGLLTPAPLIEETETDQIMEWGGPVAVIERRRRWVTDWFPVDRGEGDGSADRLPDTPCPEHRPVQHRDGKPPWCSLCGLTKEGLRPVSKLDNAQRPGRADR